MDNEALKKARLRLVEIQNEAQSLAAELYTMGLDYGELIEKSDVLAAAMENVLAAMIKLRAAFLQVEEAMVDL